MGAIRRDRGNAKSDKPGCSASSVRALRCRENDKGSGAQAPNADMEGNYVGGSGAYLVASTPNPGMTTG